MLYTDRDYSWRTCVCCGDDFPAERASLGYFTCLACGEDQAKEERKSWTVIQEYGKGGYMYVPAESARTALKQTNQKQLRD